MDKGKTLFLTIYYSPWAKNEAFAPPPIKRAEYCLVLYSVEQVKSSAHQKSWNKLALWMVSLYLPQDLFLGFLKMSIVDTYLFLKNCMLLFATKSLRM